MKRWHIVLACLGVIAIFILADALAVRNGQPSSTVQQTSNPVANTPRTSGSPLPNPATIEPPPVQVSSTPSDATSTSPAQSPSTSTNSWLTHKDLTNGFQISYPPTDTLSTGDQTYQPASQIGNGVMQVSLPASEFSGTNLHEALVLISASSSPFAVANCTNKTYTDNSPMTSHQAINGISFATDAFDDAGAGNYYDSNIYRTVRKNTCYEINLFFHSSNIGMYPAGAVKEFDKIKIMGELTAILKTFHFLP